MKGYLLFLCSLLAGLSFASSSLEVEAVVLPTSYGIAADRVLTREGFDLLSPDDATVQSMMEQVANVDPRFSNLSQYGSLAYFITVDTAYPSNMSGPVVGFKRQKIGSYKFYIMPYLEGAPGTTRGSMIAYIGGSAGVDGWSKYSGYSDPEINVGTSWGREAKNALFGSDAMEGRPAYVFGYTFDLDGNIISPISLMATNSDSYVRAFNIALGSPDQLTESYSGVLTYVVRGNLVNMPAYYKITSLDNDSLAQGSDDGDEGFFAGLWASIVEFFSPLVDFFKNITEWLIGLVVPEGEFFKEYWEGWDSWMEERFGLAYQGIGILTGVYRNVMTRVNRDRVIRLGTLFGGQAVIDYGTVERELPALFAFIQMVLRFFAIIGMVRAAVNMLLSMFADREVGEG